MRQMYSHSHKGLNSCNTHQKSKKRDPFWANNIRAQKVWILIQKQNKDVCPASIRSIPCKNSLTEKIEHSSGNTILVFNNNIIIIIINNYPVNTSFLSRHWRTSATISNIPSFTRSLQELKYQKLRVIPEHNERNNHMEKFYRQQVREYRYSRSWFIIGKLLINVQNSCKKSTYLHDGRD